MLMKRATKQGDMYFSGLKRQRKKLVKSEELKMFKKFLKSYLSAAGVSHVVTAKTVFRRGLWIIALLMISAVMMLMTYNVLQEYLKYPTVMHMKKESLKEMEFPAVTVCSYNLIPRHHHREASLQYLEEMLNLLEKLPVYNIDASEKFKCLKNPYCRWLRFTDTCHCMKTACISTECYPHTNESVCVCSHVFCRPTDAYEPEDCWIVHEGGQDVCVCKRNFHYHQKTPKHANLSQGFLEALEIIPTSSKVKELLKDIKRSKMASAKDIEKFIKPNIFIRDNYGISFDNLIVSCTFGSSPCNVVQDMVTVYSPTYGKCYTFNYAGDQNSGAQVKIAKNAGRTHGLQLYMKSPKDNIFPLFALNLGARVVVHDPRSLPFASEKGFDIRSGDMTTMAVQYEEVNRLGPPWTECAWDGDNETSSYLEKPYNLLGCTRKCMNSHVFEKCNCYYDRFLSGTIIPIRNHICTADDDVCIKSIMREKRRGRYKCRCPPPCREKKYHVSISTGTIHSEFFRVLKLARTLKMVNGTPAVAEPEINLDIMGLHVYLHSFAAVNTTETSIYSWEFLVSNVGGNLGLFLGLSLITFVEVAEFIVDITAQAFCKKRRALK